MKTGIKALKPIYTVGALISLSLASLGCGNIRGASNVLKAPVGSYDPKYMASGLGGASASGYSCPASANVLPDYDYNMNGTDHFTVCASQTSKFDILVHGQTQSSDTICIFPAQVVDAQHIYTKPDLTTGLPMYHCVQVAAAGAYDSYPSVNFNAAYIVEKGDEAQMQQCLFGGNYYFCPHNYSYGTFR